MNAGQTEQRDVVRGRSGESVGRRVLRAGLVSLGVVVLVGVLGFVLLRMRPLWVNDQHMRVQLWRQGVESRFVVVNGERMHFFDAPATGVAGGGQPLLLVHGFGAQATDWVNLLPLFRRAGFHVYAPDLLGYGQSAKPDIAYTIAQEEAAVVGFMQAEGLAQPDVAGWSMGGWVTMKLAADHPERVKRLVLYDSAGTYFDLEDAGQLFFPTTPAGLDLLFGRLTPRPVQLPGFVARDILRRMQDSAWVRHRNLRAMLSGRDLMEFRLGEIRQPTLVMWGKEDHLISVEVGRELAARLPDARFVPVEGCGHLAPSECAAEVAGVTVGFLRGQDAR